MAYAGIRPDQWDSQGHSGMMAWPSGRLPVTTSWPRPSTLGRSVRLTGNDSHAQAVTVAASSAAAAAFAVAAGCEFLSR